MTLCLPVESRDELSNLSSLARGRSSARRMRHRMLRKIYSVHLTAEPILNTAVHPDSDTVVRHRTCDMVSAHGTAQHIEHGPWRWRAAARID